jgi:hypothetical protein
VRWLADSMCVCVCVCVRVRVLATWKDDSRNWLSMGEWREYHEIYILCSKVDMKFSLLTNERG